MQYRDPNDTYLSRNFERLIKQYGGKWIVISGGRPVGIGTKKMVRRYLELAKKKNPDAVPLISSIPTRKQVHCILSNSHTRR